MTVREFVVKHLEPLMERWTHREHKVGYLPLDEVITLIDKFFEPKERCGAPMDIIIGGVQKCCNKPIGHDGMHQWSLSREA